MESQKKRKFFNILMIVIMAVIAVAAIIAIAAMKDLGMNQIEVALETDKGYEVVFQEDDNGAVESEKQSEKESFDSQLSTSEEKSHNSDNKNEISKAESDKSPSTNMGGSTEQKDPAAEAPKPVAKTCTIEIRCDTILNNMDKLKAEKVAYVPSDGTVLKVTTVEFEEGETVFDILERVCRTKGIQLEYSWSPMYGTSYIEGINHLYEFDCGDQSGWIYKVNAVAPNYGASAYTLKAGDSIKWLYSCRGYGSDV